MQTNKGHVELSDIGGECSNCGCEDKWQTLHEDSQPIRKNHRTGAWMEWHETFEVRCTNLIEVDENTHMEKVECGNTTTIERDNEVEYEKDY